MTDTNNAPVYNQDFSNKEMLTTEEAAAYLRVSKSYLYKQTSKKLIPYYKPTGKLCYFKKSDLDAWLMTGRVLTQNEIEQKAQAYCLKRRK